MSDPEDGQKVQRGPGTKARPAPLQTATPNQLHPLTPLKEVPEQEEEEEETAGASNNNTIMGKVKKRLSILPAALSGWFSPSSKPDAAASSPQQELHRQPNGCTKRKRGRRRIVLAEADAEADDVDDGSDATGLNYEEVALADNITEHDLAAEDEQTRRSEYNVFLLRRQRNALAATGGEEDDVEEDDVEEDVEEEECDEEDEDDVHGQVAKRQRLKMETTVSLPQMRRMPLSSSTPAASLVPASASVSVGGARSNNNQLPPHRRTHLNLYQNQRNREPAFNFFTGNEAAAEGTTGDLPQSNRRSLNIPFGIVAGGGSSRNNSSLSLSSLPNHKRPPLMMGKRPELRDRNLIDSTGDRQHDLIINNNNNNVEKPSRQTDLGSAGGTTAPSGGGDSNSESDHVELNFQDNGDAHHNHNNNSHLEFYGNLQSTKSLFNRTNAQPTLHNSTWSLNSLSNRRTFNASIYGSTSALSDSRLLSHRGSAASSVSSSGSPFYQGPTAFGGNSANNRFFNRSSSAASSTSTSLLGNNSRFNMPGTGSGSIGMKPTEMRFNNPAETSGSSAAISKTTHRILHLLDRYSTPLIDVKRMGSVLKEHQSSRKLRNNAPAGSPYSLPRNSTSITGSLQNPVANLAELRSNKLLLPTMQQLLERRCLNRVTTNTRNLMQMPKQSVPAAEDTDTVVKAAAKTVPSSSVSAATPVVDQPSSHSHRSYKMRSKLSHQTQGRSKEAREEEAAPPPLDLPQISFPDMASTPKFDLVIEKTPGSHKAAVPTTTASKGNSNINSTLKKTNFLVNPQPMNDVSLAANGGGATAAKRRFAFAKPTPLSFNLQNTSVDELNVIKRSFVFSAPIPLDAESKQVKAAINGLPPQGFGEQFKKSGKEWDCDVCMVRNKAEAGKCVACETAKPAGGVSKAFPAPTTLFEQFKKSSKEWDCEVCMVRNKVEAGKCVACETPKPKATAPAAPTPLPPIVPIGGGFGDRFKKSSTAWECEACMVTNKEADGKCIACMTPRKAVMTTTTTKSNNFPMTSVSGVGFGDAFKLKTGQWECQTCMVMNESTSVECVACQTANPRLGNSEPSSSSSSSSSSSASSSAASAPASPRAANSVTSSTSFKFGFAPGTSAAVAAPKQDAGFQQLVAAQKTASWNCDACLAQNDMSRNKCLCCEQLKPGSSPTSTTSTKSSGLTVPGAGSSVPKFTFGFAPVQPAKTGFAKEETKATTATSSTEETDAAAAPAPAPALIQPFAFGAPPTLSSASSSTAMTTTATISSSPALGGFSFGAPSSSSSTVSSSSANSMPAAKPMFSLSVAGGTASAVSSTSSSQQPASKTETFGFGVSNAITTTTTSSTGFSLKPAATPATAPQFAAAIPASAADPAPAPAAAAAPSFSFGNPPKTVSTPAAAAGAGSFFFGQPPASTPAPPAVNAGVSSIFGSTTAAASTSISTAAASSVSSNSTAVVAPSNPQPFSFGGATKKPEETTAAKPFVFGSGGLGAATTTTTAMPSFGWPSNGATGMNSSSSSSSGGSSAVTSTAAVSSSQGIMMAQPIFASSSAMFGAPGSITSSSSSSSLFGSTATTAAATPAAVSLGGNGGLATVFGNVGNSMVAPVATPAATPATAASGPLANIFGNPTAIAAPASSSSSTSVFGSGSGGFGQGAAAATTPALGQGGGGSTKPAFNFGGAVAATATQSSGAPFNFGSSTAAAAKPTFNFTGSVTASTPQAGAFTFTANPTTGPLAAGDAQGIFRFGAPSAVAAEIGGAGLAGPGEAAASTSSFVFGGVPPMFNLSNATPQTEMQSTSNANAPFQFGGAPAPANIFAFNQPAGQSAQNSQMVRRKVRTPMRRLPPR